MICQKTISSRRCPLPPPLRRWLSGHRWLVPLLPLLVGGVTATAASPDDELFGPAFNLVIENDMVVRTDRHYTHGTKLNLMGGEIVLSRTEPGPGFPAWLAGLLPEWGMRPTAARLGMSIGQSIYTPTDIKVTTLQVNDRPYAGFLYVSLHLQKRGVTGGGIPVVDQWRMDLGLIGPESLCEDAQNTVHRVRHIPTANGWGHQLKTEPGLAMRYQRTWRISNERSGNWGWDILPAAGVSLGNVGTYLALGGQVRAGWHLPRDFGMQTIDAITIPTSGIASVKDARRGLHLSAGLEGRAVAYNSFLDGSLTRESHHVRKFPLVGDFKFGVIYTGKRFDVSLTQIFRTKEFVGQPEVDAYGSLALSCKLGR